LPFNFESFDRPEILLEGANLDSEILAIATDSQMVNLTGREKFEEGKDLIERMGGLEEPIIGSVNQVSHLEAGFFCGMPRDEGFHGDGKAALAIDHQGIGRDESVPKK